MRLKRLLSTAASAVAAASISMCAVGCGNGNGDNKPWTPPENTYAYNVPQDYCRTYYEIFVRSFADGNGDGIGDFRGLINNLDYLNDGDDSTMTDLGINGIWLMPINATRSYHGYDVTDYKAVNSKYGTLGDFDELIEECGKRGIWIQMDLVLNHTSSQHVWFQKAVQEARANKLPTDADAKYLKYYDVRVTDNNPGSDWHKMSGTSNYWYYGHFSGDMPELNLVDFETNGLKEELQGIVDFWLERGVKSFRLDAAAWACATSVTFNANNDRFWSWFNGYCAEKGAEVAENQGWANDGISRYCYNVGEIWGNSNAITQFFGTGMSNFNYDMGGSSGATFVNVANGFESFGMVYLLEEIAKMQAKVSELDSAALLSNFLSNHDNSRSGGYLFNDAVKIKKAAAIYMLMPGNPYIYYGEELGAEGNGNIGKDDVDPNKRLPFNWGDESKGLTTDPPGVKYNDSFTGKQRHGSWKKQTADASSILTYYRNVIRLRNRFPEIGRGTITPYAVDKDGSLDKATDVRSANGVDAGRSLVPVNALNRTVGAYMLSWKGSDVVIVQNIGNDSATLDLSGLDGYKIVGELKANGGSVTLNSGKLKMSGATVAVLKK